MLKASTGEVTYGRLYRVLFFNCSAQISVLKRKKLFNQRGSFVHWEFHGTESLIGCPSFFILALKIGRNSCSRSKLTSPPLKNCTLARLNNLSTFFYHLNIDEERKIECQRMSDWKYFPLEIITFWTWQPIDKKNLSKTPQAPGSQAHSAAMLLDQIATFAPLFPSGSHG